MQRKSMKDRKKYTYKDIEAATGIKVKLLSKINATPNYNISALHIEKLCNYFNCTPNDLISIYPDENPE